MSTWPVTLVVDSMAAMVNCELVDHPVYDAVELQWYDDEHHGTGMVAVLCRRETRLVDYYRQPGLRLDRRTYRTGAGPGVWAEVDFAARHLVVADDGVDASAAFVDVDGRRVEIEIHDRDQRPRRRGGMLAPVSAGIENPTSLMLAWMPTMDLLRSTGTPPSVRFDGVDARIGRLPGQRWHRRCAVKYAAPVVLAHVCPDDLAGTDAPEIGDGLADLTAWSADGLHVARLEAGPALPAPDSFVVGAPATGTWTVSVDGHVLTGGQWRAERDEEESRLSLDVTRRWRPRALPMLMRVVTTVIPVFTRWPTTYAWRARVRRGTPGLAESRWLRTGDGGGDDYRRVVGAGS